MAACSPKPSRAGPTPSRSRSTRACTRWRPSGTARLSSSRRWTGAATWTRAGAFAERPPSALLGRGRGGRAHAPDLDDGLLVLGAVVVHLARVVDDVAPRGRGHGRVGVELLAGSHPPGTRQDHEETIVGVEVRPAHVPGQPLDPRDVQARLARVPVKD